MTTPTVPAGSLGLDPTQVQVGTNENAGIYLAPEGTAAPTIDDDFAAPWMSFGYLSSDGPTVGQSSTSTTITPWQSAVPIRTLITDRGVTIHTVCWQINELTLSVLYDIDPTSWDNTTDTLDLQIRSDSPSHTYAVAISTTDQGMVFRLSFTRANLSATGDMTIQRGAVIPLDVTLSALDDNGVLGRLQRGPSAAGGGGTTDPGTDPGADATTPAGFTRGERLDMSFSGRNGARRLKAAMDAMSARSGGGLAVPAPAIRIPDPARPRLVDARGMALL